MSELKAVSSSSPILRKPCELVDVKSLRSANEQKLINQLLDFVYGKSNKGENRNNNAPATVGLSANQVGIDKRIVIVDLGIGHKDFHDVHVLINPIITWSSKTLQHKAEGCVNLKNIWGIVDRSNRVKVDAFDRSGNKLSLDLHGWPAALLQHEIDHINGKLFIDRLTNPKKAHLVKDNQYLEYRKSHKVWEKFIDVSNLAKS